MARVAAIIIAFLVGVGLIVFYTTKDDDKKVDAAPTEPAKVYPERGVTNGVNGEDIGLVCDTSAVASIKLADDKGTVSHNGTLITSTWDEDSVLITFDGEMQYLSGYVVGAKNAEPFNIPENIRGKNSPGLVLDTKDFSESGKFIDIYLCGGRM